MSQAWLTVIGLSLDFLGVLLFSREWWTALKAERTEAEIEARKAMLKPNPMMPANNNPNHAVFDWMREQQEARQRATGQPRRARRAGNFT